MKKIVLVACLLSLCTCMTSCGNNSVKNSDSAVNGTSLTDNSPSVNDYSQMPLPELFLKFSDEFSSFESLDVDEALKQLKGSKKETALISEMENVLEDMKQCQGYYLQEPEKDSSQNYTASFQY